MEKIVRWIIILQEYDLKFSNPKSKKYLDLAQLISYIPTSISDSLINYDLPDEHLFTISLYDPWYGDIIVCLQTQKFYPVLSNLNFTHK